MTSGRDLISIGMIAAQVARPVEECLLAIASLAIDPVITLNSVPYFERESVPPLVARIVGKDSAAGDPGPAAPELEHCK